MKKLLKILVVALLLAVIASGIVLFIRAFNDNLLVKNITEITLVGTGETVKATTSHSADSIIAFEGILKEGLKLEALPEMAVHSGNVQVTAKGKLVNYSLYHKDDLLVIGKDGRYLSIDRTAWNNFTNGFDSGLYVYSAIPIISVNGADLPVLESDYTYQKMDGYYYATNKEKDITLPIIQLTVGEKLAVSLAVEPISTVITINGADANWTGSLADFAGYTPPGIGKSMVNITSTYGSDYYLGTVTYAFEGEYKALPREISFDVIGNDTYPGEIVILKVSGAESVADINVSTDINFTPVFFSDGDGEFTALMAVGYSTEVGSYSVKLGVGDEEKEFEITVNDKDFQIQNIEVDETTTAETIDSAAANEEYNNAIVPVRKLADTDPHWRGTDFIWPVGKDARVTTEFGMIRYVNGRPTSVRHGAIDFAVPKGTEVGATNNGTVLYAGFLQLTGNTVVIEHGFGLKSWYYHMDSLSVRAQDTVVAGQKIGEVGSTGFSTGAHLHFGTSVNGIKVNPITIIDDRILG